MDCPHCQLGKPARATNGAPQGFGIGDAHMTVTDQGACLAGNVKPFHGRAARDWRPHPSLAHDATGGADYSSSARGAEHRMGSDHAAYLSSHRGPARCKGTCPSFGKGSGYRARTYLREGSDARNKT